MRLWISKHSEVPIREQLVTQFRLAILSEDLKPGQKLPSTRELARRYQIHANTVSAAYRELEERGWVNFAHGSGVYVRKFAAEMRLDAELDLDQIISEFLQLAREKGFALNEIRLRLRHWLELQPPDHFLLIEPDEKLRQIIAAEIQEATNFPVVTCGVEECGQREVYFGSMPVALYGQGEIVRAALPPHSHLLLLRLRSVTEALKNEKRPSPEDLLIVVSAVPDFLDWSRSVLSAIGIDSLSLEFRDANQRGWQRGLEASTFVITETVTEKIIPAGVRARVFKMISDASLAELQKFVAHLKTD
ncbi:MAG TPA: GntR family transcriptional regulator [Blastocatellia bacterium]|nr:GntR family transcriptional regulator [Blastocatellia bacterium]